MKNVRITYKKKGDLKFISHLDLNRLMLRLVRRAGLPIWYTEGFHPHPYMTFALPLSLGFESDYDVMDVRITDDAFDVSTAAQMLNRVTPPGLEFLDSFAPEQKVGSISAADFLIRFYDADASFRTALSNFLSSNEIPVEKKKKNGTFETVDLSQKMIRFTVSAETCDTILTLTLPAGSRDNVNPMLFLNEFFRRFPDYSSLCYAISRGNIYDETGDLFR